MTTLTLPSTAEHRRLSDSADRRADWKNWGPYLAERAWGTVREDYSHGGNAWDFFPHDHARSRAYRWNEDGLAGFCNRFQNICLSLALWNGRDPYLKERLYGLANEEGNHGEDVKEYYFYLDGVPTHSYMRMLYKYPQAEYPYERLLAEGRRRSRSEPEFELIDALGQSFAEGRYFDVDVEYAKANEEDILCRITAYNRGPDPAELHILPNVWYRNTWSWGYGTERPTLWKEGSGTVRTRHRHLGERFWYLDDSPELLFTENETNRWRLFGVPNDGPYVKDSFHEAVVHGRRDCVNPAGRGSKAAGHYRAIIPPGGSMTVRTRLAKGPIDDPFRPFDAIVNLRRAEADEYYNAIHAPGLDEDRRSVQRQAFAGLLWSKQFYHYSVELWLDGDPAGPAPPPARLQGRNSGWRHLYNLDVLSVPDKWEYPWFAAWDTAFHCIVLARIDPEWAKRQVILLLREWYMHPSGQLAAYEWDFGDANPPVHAHAALRVYQIDREINGKGDVDFLEEVFHKLLLNFTWWVNRKDAEGRNVFQGGFLGLDNIGVFDRSAPLPTGGHIEQSDGTSWMAMFSLNMMTIALELARTNPVYEDIATKFFEHFMYIAGAMNNMGREGISLWDEEDQFFYDVLRTPDGRSVPLRVHSLVGLIPLLAVEVVEPDSLKKFPAFKSHLEWFLEHRPQLAGLVSHWHTPGIGERRQLALVRGHRFKQLLKRALDPAEFLSDHGIRSVSKYHEAHPYTLRVGDATYVVPYDPAESRSGLFGGNSNWRGPVWFPVNYLLIEALQKFHDYYGDDFKIECPTGSGRFITIDAVANELAQRLISLFTRGDSQRRPFNGGNSLLQNDPNWRDYILFYEYFNGDNGAGLGAGHQTGWSGLVAELIQQLGENLPHQPGAPQDSTR